MSASRRDRLRGCLVGQCLGDALGFPVEGQPPEVCARYDPAAMPPRGRAPFPFGQYTDDSQLARELLDSLVTNRGWVADDYAARVAAIFVEERIVGRGRATENAARRLASGVPWQQAGELAPSAGNGSAMRAAPVGMYFGDDLGRVRDVAVEQGRITHQDPRACAGAVAIAAGAAIALRGGGAVDAIAFAAELASIVEPVDAGVAAVVRAVPSLFGLPHAGAVAGVRQGADFSDGWRGISPFVTESVAWSLYAFLRTPDDYAATIRCAIQVGGDVDTTAAMAGALSGARNGYGALPQALVVRLNDQGTWGLVELLALADRVDAQV